MRSSLIGASGILDLMEWDRIMENEVSPIPVFEPLQTEGAIVLKPDDTGPLEETQPEERPVYPVNGSGHFQTPNPKQQRWPECNPATVPHRPHAAQARAEGVRCDFSYHK